MKVKLEKFLSYLLYLICVLISIIGIYWIKSGSFYNYRGDMKVALIFILGVSICLFIYLGNLFYSLSTGKKKILRIGLIIYLIIYALLVLWFTCRGFNLTFDISSKSFNFIPFKDTIELIFDVIKNGFESRLVMIIGNLLLLVPLSFFLPRIFIKLKFLPKFCLISLLSAITIESVQLFLGNGVFDIDDIILNSLGAIFSFPLFNSCFLGRVLDKMFLFDSSKLNKRDILKSIILIIGVIAIIILCIYLYWYKDPAIEIEILDDIETCDIGNTLIYEDDYYQYFYPCNNADNLYVIFNKKHKFNLKDLLNKKIVTRWAIYYDKDNLRYESIIEKKEKYPFIEIESKNNNIIFEYKFENDDILKFENTNYIVSNSSTKFSVSAIPLKVGKTKVKFEIKDITSDKTIETLNYKFIVDENLNIKYEADPYTTKIIKNN